MHISFSSPAPPIVSVQNRHRTYRSLLSAPRARWCRASGRKRQAARHRTRSSRLVFFRAESESLHACGNGSESQSFMHSGINMSSFKSGVEPSIPSTSPTGQQQHSSWVRTTRSIMHIFSSRLTRRLSIRAAYPPASSSANAVRTAPDHSHKNAPSDHIFQPSHPGVRRA